MGLPGTPPQPRHGTQRRVAGADHGCLGACRQIEYRAFDLFAQHVAQRHQQLRSRQGVRGRRGVEAVGREHQLGCGAELGSQEVGQRHRHTARRLHRRGLGAGEVPGSRACQRAKRLGNRSDHTQIRAGANDHRRAPRTQLTHRFAQPPRGLTDPVEGGDVVGADHHHGHVRRRPGHEHRIDLPAHTLRGGADNRLGAQPNTLAGLLGEPARDQHTRHFFGAHASVPGGGRVPEDHQVQVRGHAALPPFHRAAARAVHAVGAGRDVPGLGDDGARAGRLADQQVACAQIGRPRRGECARCGQGDCRTTSHPSHGISLDRLSCLRGHPTNNAVTL